MGSRIRRRLSGAPAWLLSVYAVGAAFSTYFCMYAFRKPFAAAHFEGAHLADTQIELKTAFVLSQLLGYALSKYLGIKLVSELSRERRAGRLLLLIGVAELALVAFGLLPPAWAVLAMFLNGLPLGMVWGTVVSYLEGRRTSDAWLAGLCASFILASGAVKDVGRWLMSAQHVPEAWMPAVTGALFFLPFALSVFLLNQIPPPTDADVAARSRRAPMDSAARRAFVRRFLPGLALLLVVYVLATAFRDYRDNYGAELFAELGFGATPAIFTRTELPVAFGVLLGLALLNLFRSHRAGLVAAFGLMLAGALLLLACAPLLHTGVVDGAGFMLLTGLGSYLIYVPYNSVLFERLMAATGSAGTAVFSIYLADSLGYTGSVVAQIQKDIFAASQSRLAFFESFVWLFGCVSIVALTLALIYFLQRVPREAQT
ncbi:MAG: hypothetical protein GXP55_01740 [Deltaproteobacteria bacterium]|nr:hypothetical protein [Deltaproteobacteria bacterium]